MDRNVRVGCIGLGAMGLPMAMNLQRTGYELHVAAHHRRGPVEALMKQGAVEHACAADVISNADVVITILPRDQEAEQVLLSERTLAAFQPGTILLEMTSGSPGMMSRIEEAYRARGVRVLDAPVSGGTAGAQQGTLTVMAGGEPEVLEACRPVLEAMARQIYLVGPVGAGKALKAINQMLAGIHMLATAEAASMASKLGVDPGMLRQVVGNSSGASWMFMNKLESFIAGNFEPGFKLALMRKDVQIAVEEGSDRALPLASLALQLYRIAERDDADADFSAVGKLVLPPKEEQR